MFVVNLSSGPEVVADDEDDNDEVVDDELPLSLTY